MSVYGDGTYGDGIYGARYGATLASPSPRSVDPSPCWVRHIVRGQAGELSAVQVGRVWFVRDEIVRDEDGINGRQGWQHGETTAVLSDDGTFTLVLANTTGADGVLHRRRFAVLTDPDYEPGEEWLEFCSDFDQERPFFVGTPTDYEKSKSAVTIKGADLNEVLTGALSSEVDVWDGTAPADIFAHYSRLPVLAHGESGLAWALTTATAYDAAFTGAAADCWTIEVEMQVKYQPAGELEAIVDLVVDGVATIEVDLFDGVATISPADSATFKGRKFGLTVPASLSLRLVARYDHMFCFANGELAGDWRRPMDALVAPAALQVSVGFVDGVEIATLDTVHVETLVPFATRGPSAGLQRRLPGIPPATGLHGRYWSTAEINSRAYATAVDRQAAHFPLGLDPITDRLDPKVDFTTAPIPGIGSSFAARWTGAIYLDLATSDRRIKLSGYGGRVRLYVGRTLRGEEAAGDWWVTTVPTVTTLSLRDWIGESEAGWYPIVLELSQAGPVMSIVMQDAPFDDAGLPLGSYAVVPQARLSPIGCYEDILRNTPHRTVIGDVAQAFGYQWRALPRSLESGEFPGQLEFGSLIGRQTNVVVDDDQVGSEAVVQGAARDVVDGLVADAAGIADPQGSGQLSAQVIDFARAIDHLALRQGYESLSEITEAPLLQVRVDSLLGLRSSPNEQVGVRPGGQIDLVDSFELTGELAKMRWEPGDGVLLDLESIDVTDSSPRQLTSVTWSPRPDGLGVPTVGFRQRPRSPSAALKRLRAAVFGPRRTYQGSRALISGSPGGTSGAHDAYSRAPLPTRLSDVVRVYAVVQVLTGTAWRLEVEGTDLGPDGNVKELGRHDITRAVLAAAATGGPYTYARLIGGAGGDTYLMTLEVVVKV